ncbi:hypothetical protein ACFYPC_12075 [Streptomyces sp. NPDC005808]|uniref:hypothetical protein n=1 Tax=Streptomyces sp. NPDC005808 TaxID=3364734 RepID=UPI00369DC3B2
MIVLSGCGDPSRPGRTREVPEAGVHLGLDPHPGSARPQTIIVVTGRGPQAEHLFVAAAPTERPAYAKATSPVR